MACMDLRPDDIHNKTCKIPGFIDAKHASTYSLDKVMDCVSTALKWRNAEHECGVQIEAQTCSFGTNNSFRSSMNETELSM
jgi:hypothetical protein